MARPLQVSEAVIRQACADLQASGKPVTIRGVHAVTGGGLSRVTAIVDTYKAEHGLSAPGAPANPPSPAREIPDDVLNAGVTFIKTMWQRAEQVSTKKHESDNIRKDEDVEISNDDRDYVLNQNSLLEQANQALEDALQNEKAERLKDHGRHADALKTIQKDFNDQLADLQNQISKLNQKIQTLSEEKAKAESERDETVKQLGQATDKIRDQANEMVTLIIGKAQAEGAKTVMESQLKISQENFDRLERQVKVLSELITKQQKIVEQAPSAISSES